MLTAKSIRDKCNKDILELQKICNHPNSTWCEDWTMGIGHSSGQVKLCDICEKILESNLYRVPNIITEST